MKTYQVDLLCDGNGCKAVITSDTAVNSHRANELVDRFAETRGWKPMPFGDWLCPECAAKLTEQGK